MNVNIHISWIACSMAMLVWLRVWVGVIAAVALASAVQSFLNGQYLQERIYTLQPHEGW